MNFPKVFRRQADPHVRRAVGDAATPPSFLAYLASKKDDLALRTDTFLNSHGSTTDSAFKKRFTPLAGFVRNGRYPMGPGSGVLGG